MKTTIKDLENKLYELEKYQYKLNDNIYKLESKVGDLKSIQQVKNIYQLFDIVNDLKKRIENLEMLHDPKSGIRHEEQPKYKVGDYVEFYDAEKVKHKGYLKYDGCDWFVDCFNIDIENIIGYAKPDLLTQEEKEYLSAVIKCLKNDNEQLYINKVRQNDFVICNDYQNLIFIYVDNCKYKFNNLSINKRYSLSELGL